MSDQKESKKGPLKKIPSTVLSRSFALAKMTLSTGTSLASHGLTNLFSGDAEKEEKWKSFLTQQAKNLSLELGELKGSLMKAGQSLSMYGEYFLPPEANQFLKTLQAKSPPLEWGAIYKILQVELGPVRLRELEIDQVAIGSASLGQVHKARIKSTGEWIALKVQYPGVTKAIDSDLKALRSILSFFKFVPKGIYLDNIFEEVKAMLIQETNYRLEARETKAYRERLKEDPRYIVPKIFDEYCSDRVIASSLEEGHFADSAEVQALDQNRRNEIARAFLELYFQELFDWGIVQTDPHLGNYKIRLAKDSSTERDQLILLDFGAVRTYPEEFLKPYYRMIASALKNDRKNLAEAALQLKFLMENDNDKLTNLFQEFCLMTVEPFLSQGEANSNLDLLNEKDEYDWKSSDLPQRLTKKAFQMIQEFAIRPPPREVIFLDRKTGGVFVFLSVLRARINGRPLLDKYLEPS